MNYAAARRHVYSSPKEIRIGKDILELITGAMYVNPLDIYREYIQNAADALDEKRLHGCDARDVMLSIDVSQRCVTIRDNGAGISNRKFDDVMTSIGDSPKRGTGARGFRGIGRLSGLGYCRKLVFRSKADSDKRSRQITWDGLAFRHALRNPEYGGSLSELVRDVTKIETVDSSIDQSFFEVELHGVIRLSNDILLNLDAIKGYLAQVAPLDFDSKFTFAAAIQEKLLQHDIRAACEIMIEEEDSRPATEAMILRPHRDSFKASARNMDRISGVQFFEIQGLEGGTDAVGWIADHGHYGAIPKSELLGGLRIRLKNIEIGGSKLLAEHFPEPRFNSWTIGEVHILNPRIVPNGRRDDFEENAHYQNLLSHLSPILRSVGKTCRNKSSTRQWLRRFETSEQAIKEDLRRLEGGSVSKRQLKSLAAEVDERILELDNRINCSKYEFAQDLKPRVRRLKSRLNRFLDRDTESAVDPLGAVPYQKRLAFKEVLGLVYHYSANRVVANQLIERITKSLAAKYSS